MNIFVVATRLAFAFVAATVIGCGGGDDGGNGPSPSVPDCTGTIQINADGIPCRSGGNPTLGQSSEPECPLNFEDDWVCFGMGSDRTCDFSATLTSVDRNRSTELGVAYDCGGPTLDLVLTPNPVEFADGVSEVQVTGSPP